MPDITDQHQRTAVQLRLTPIWRGIDNVVDQSAGDHLAGFFKIVLKRSPHQLVPIVISQDFVRRIDSSN